MQEKLKCRKLIEVFKRNHNWLYLDKEESILYMFKMNILYRHIMFQILEINDDLYRDGLIANIALLNKWNDTLTRFMLKFHK